MLVEDTKDWDPPLNDSSNLFEFIVEEPKPIGTSVYYIDVSNSVIYSEGQQVLDGYGEAAASLAKRHIAGEDVAELLYKLLVFCLLP